MTNIIVNSCFDGEVQGKNPLKSSRISSIMTCCDLDARQEKNSSHCLHMTAQHIDQHSKLQFHKHWVFAIAMMNMQSLYQIFQQNQLSYSFFTNSLVDTGKPSAAQSDQKELNSSHSKEGLTAETHHNESSRANHYDMGGYIVFESCRILFEVWMFKTKWETFKKEYGMSICCSGVVPFGNGNLLRTWNIGV